MRSGAAPLVVLLCALLRPAGARSRHRRPPFDCGWPRGHADVSIPHNCQERRGPINETYSEWLVGHRQWQSSARRLFDFSPFESHGVEWARTSFVQPQAMLHDRYLYDREAKRWTVDKYMKDVEDRFGGIDSILLWQFYPNAGIDARNNYEFIDSLPGGMDAVRDLVAAFHGHGVKVLWPIFPWDTGTHDFGSQPAAQVAKAIETGADGYNGDTMPGVPASFWEEAQRRGVPLVAEPEIMVGLSDGDAFSI